MADPRFFRVGGPFTLARLAEISGSLIGEGADPDAFFNGVAPLDEAGPEDVSYGEHVSSKFKVLAANWVTFSALARMFVSMTDFSSAATVSQDSRDSASGPGM